MLADSRLIKYFPTVILPAIWVTIKMVVIAAVFSIFFGMILGSILVLTKKDGLRPNRIIHFMLEKITDIVRSFPTMILIVALIPLTRAVIGTSVGADAAIFSITIGCIPFATRMTENALLTVDEQLIRAAQSMGATDFQIFYKVLFVEGLPVLVSNFTIMLINMLNMSAMAGAVGAGGLGAVALTYGYQRFDEAVMYAVVAILIVIVLLIQGLAKIIYKKLK